MKILFFILLSGASLAEEPKSLRDIAPDTSVKDPGAHYQAPARQPQKKGFTLKGEPEDAAKTPPIWFGRETHHHQQNERTRRKPQ